MPQLRRSVESLQAWRSGFEPRSCYVRFVVDIAELAQVSFGLPCPPCSTFIIIILGGYNAPFNVLSNSGVGSKHRTSCGVQGWRQRLINHKQNRRKYQGGAGRLQAIEPNQRRKASVGNWTTNREAGRLQATEPKQRCRASGDN